MYCVIARSARKEYRKEAQRMYEAASFMHSYTFESQK